MKVSRIVLLSFALTFSHYAYSAEAKEADTKPSVEKEFPYYYKNKGEVNTNLHELPALKKYFTEPGIELNPTNYSIKTPFPAQTPLPYSGTTSYSQATDYILTGYGIVNFVDIEHYQASFDMSSFNPTFLFRYKECLMWETQLEFTINEDSSIDTQIEYAYFDWFIRKNVVFMGGKFLSPIGKFVNTLYLPWLNKLPTSPAGFAEYEAAPQADLGIELRGTGMLSDCFGINYAFFIANGPELAVNNNILEFINSDGFPVDRDHRKIYGGRIGFILLPSFEVGVSGSMGEIGLFIDDFLIENPRDYYTIDVDANFTYCDVDARFEYVQQEVGSQPLSLYPSSAKWEAWYAQLAYKFCDPWELVARYGDFSSPVPEQGEHQFAFGLNYWVSPVIVVKVAYEINDGLEGTLSDANQFIVNFSMGF